MQNLYNKIQARKQRAIDTATRRLFVGFDDDEIVAIFKVPAPSIVWLVLLGLVLLRDRPRWTSQIPHSQE